MKTYKDLNYVRGANPEMWLDRREATCLMVQRHPDRPNPPVRRSGRVSMTPAMRGLLVSLRRRAGVTSEEAARIAGHTQAWMSHVEIGNTETISEEDFDALLMRFNAMIGDRGEAAG